MNWIRLAPVTAESIIVCVVIFLSCLAPSKLSRERFADLQRECGAIQTLKSFDSLDGIRRCRELELYGPFDVWNGGWWRIPLTVIHHTDLLHLVLSLGATWYLGRRLERHLGSFGMCLFLLPAFCIPVLAELVRGQAMMGFSGVVCAMLGTLVVLRHFDRDVAAEFSKQAAEIGMSIMVLAWLASAAGVCSFPNAGHLAGFAYGGLIGLMDGFGRRRSVRFVIPRSTMILVQLLLVPASIVICHPVWLARYHWHQAISSNNASQIETCLRKASRCDPALAAVWLSWSRLAESKGDFSQAWTLLIRGLAHNPSSSPMVEGTQRLWRHLNSEQRREAEVVTQDVFGPAASRWMNQIRQCASVPNTNYNEEVRNIEDIADPSQFALDQQIELRAIEPNRTDPKHRAPLIPANENDAMEGKSL